MNGHELDGAELAVDTSNEFVDNSAEVLILLDILAGGNSDLYKNNLADPLRVFGKEDLKSVQFLRNTLDIIQTVDADDKLDALELLLECRNAFLDLGLLQALVELLRVDTNRESADSNNLSLEFDTVWRCCKAPEQVSIYMNIASWSTYKIREQLLRK